MKLILRRSLLVVPLVAGVAATSLLLLPGASTKAAPAVSTPAPVAATTPVAQSSPDPAAAATKFVQHPVKVAAAAKPAAKKVTVVSHPTAKKQSTKKTATHHTSYPAGPTSWGALNAAIARIPSYRPGIATWKVYNTGWWGTSDWYAGIIYISPSTPESKLYDVAVHEWSHILSVHTYGGNVSAAVNAMNAYFGGGKTMAPEYAADCMARLQGATWTHYTSCSNSAWRTGARLLLDGQHLPL